MGRRSLWGPRLVRLLAGTADLEYRDEFYAEERPLLLAGEAFLCAGSYLKATSRLQVDRECGLSVRLCFLKTLIKRIHVRIQDFFLIQDVFNPIEIQFHIH